MTRPAGAGTEGRFAITLAHLDYAERHYRRADDSLTHEVDEYRLISRYVRELYGTTPAVEFGPLALKAVRQRFIEVGWCRSLINQRIGRVRRIFKWAASEQLVPVSVHQALCTVQGLLKGRTEVRESEPVGPVADEVVDATLPFLNRHVRGLVEFQRLTGCRPGEACALRWCDLDTSGVVWVYRPPHHKTAWRGKTRTIAVGPKAQSLLEQFRTADPTAHVFSPALAVAEFHAGRGAGRKTPRYASHMGRNARKRKTNPERTPTAAYTASSYGHAVVRACDRAFPPAPHARPQRRRDGSGVGGTDDGGATEGGGGVAEGAPLAPEPTAAPVRHRRPQGTRVGSRPSAARSQPGRRDPGVRRTQ